MPTRIPYAETKARALRDGTCHKCPRPASSHLCGRCQARQATYHARWRARQDPERLRNYKRQERARRTA